MKIAVVPAQITTVEDRIIGSMGFSQVLLLVVPIFVSAGLYAILPPIMGNAPYKYIAILVITLICAVLAIRIKGKIIANWLITIIRYNVRPRYYLFNKNTVALRENYDQVSQTKTATSKTKTKQRTRVSLPKLDAMEAARVLATIENPAARLQFETTKKGGLHVRLTEVEE
jgi:hypothetical protein